MAKVNTSSIKFPNMFAVSQNKVGLLEDETSIANRVKLLILTDPTEVFNTPRQGVGLKKYLYQYNNENTKSRILDDVKSQLRIYEPCVDADKTEWTDGLISSGNSNSDDLAPLNTLEMSIILHTQYDTIATVTVNEDSQIF